MALKTLYHGTTYDNYLAILKDGFSSPITTWGVSDDRNTYFYELDKFAKSEGIEEDEKEYQEEQAIKRCIEQAQITAGAHKYRGDKLIVFKIEIDDNFINPDSSCDNMADRGAVEVWNKDLNVNSNIVGIYQSFDYMSHMCGIYIQSFINNNDCCLDFESWEQWELDILQSIDLSNAYDEIMYIEYSEITKEA